MRIEQLFSGLQIFVKGTNYDEEHLNLAKSWVVPCFNFVSKICLNEIEDRIMRLYYFDGLSIKHISETLNLTQKEVISIKSKATTKCRQRERWDVFYSGPNSFEEQLKRELEYDMETKLKNFINKNNKNIPNIGINNLGLSTRTVNILLENKISTLPKLASKSCNDLLKLKGFGKSTVNEILKVFKNININ